MYTPRQPTGELLEKLSSINIPADVMPALEALRASGKGVVLVGGAVRDAMLGKTPKDFDFEVYGATPETLVQILSNPALGTTHVGLEGADFGIVRWSGASREQFEFAVPRQERRVGSGHRGFDVIHNPHMSYEDAFARRDFTVNAMGMDPWTLEFYDPHGGEIDLAFKVLRHTSDKFDEDPLRVLRGMRFVCALGLTLHPKTAKVCRDMAGEIDSQGQSRFAALSAERVMTELSKTLCTAKYPDQMIPYLMATGWIEFFPLLRDMVGLPQEPKWHPEINLDVHIGQVMEAMVKICDRDGVSGENRLILMLSALLHDVGKPSTQSVLELPDGGTRITTRGHAEAGADLLRPWLKNMRFPYSVTRQVCALTEYHMIHADDKATKRLRRVAGEVDLGLLRQLVEADRSGRVATDDVGTEGILPTGLGDATALFEEAERDGLIVNGRGVEPKNVITGRHFAMYGVPADRGMGTGVREAHEAQLNYAFPNTVFEENPEAQSWLEAYCKKKFSVVRWLDVEPSSANVNDCKLILAAAWADQKAGLIRTREDVGPWLTRYLNSRQPV